MQLNKTLVIVTLASMKRIELDMTEAHTFTSVQPDFWTYRTTGYKSITQQNKNKNRSCSTDSGKCVESQKNVYRTEQISKLLQELHLQCENLHLIREQ